MASLQWPLSLSRPTFCFIQFMLTCTIPMITSSHLDSSGQSMLPGMGGPQQQMQGPPPAAQKEWKKQLSKPDGWAEEFIQYDEKVEVAKEAEAGPADLAAEQVLPLFPLPPSIPPPSLPPSLNFYRPSARPPYLPPYCTCTRFRLRSHSYSVLCSYCNSAALPPCPCRPFACAGARRATPAPPLVTRLSSLYFYSHTSTTDDCTIPAVGAAGCCC